MRLPTACLAFSSLLLMSAAASAETKFDPAARARPIAPYLDPQTAVVAHVDVTRIKVDPLFDFLGRLVPEMKEELADLQAKLSGPLTQFAGAGGKDIYVVFTLGRPLFQEPVFTVVPLAPGTGEKDLGALFQNFVMERRGDALLLAKRREILDWLKTLKPAPRPEVAAGFAAAGDTAAQVLLIPPAYTSRVIEEVMPQLPKEIGNGPSSLLTRGISWAAVGIDLPPHPALRLVVKSQDAAAATALRAKWVEASGALGRLKEMRQFLPEYDRVAQLLTPTVEKDRVTLVLDERTKGINDLRAALTPAVERALRLSERTRSANNLKQLGIAMWGYHDSNGHFPTAASYSKEGKPLLSWRVALLPYLEQADLYKQFHLDEPWDSPHNKTLIAKMPPVFRSPASRLKGPEGRTNYVFPVGPGTAFAGPKPLKVTDITDGTSNTIMILEVNDDQAVIWTKPDDLPFDPKQPLKGLGGLYQEGFNVALFDGSVRFVSLKVSPETLRAAITPAGGEVLGPDW